MRVWLGLVLVLISATAAAAQSAEEQAIRARLRAYAQASEQGWAARSKFYTDDADFWASTSKALAVGKAAMEKELNQPTPPGLTFALDVSRVTLLSPEIATADAGYRVTIGDTKIGGHVFYVLVKRQGDWFIRSIRVAQITPPPQ
ncbi:MAG TPA: hypothetical protein VJ691_06030 [Vicinamibacterales bacterium]|nr:hypothetical protein [Vicinamibacterales bacterium]